MRSNTVYARDPSGNPIELAADPAGHLQQNPAGLTALGYEQITSLASATSLTVPAGATVAVIQAESQSIRWRDDGTDPTTSVGMPVAAGETIFFTGSLSGFSAIEMAASAKLNISYYR